MNSWGVVDYKRKAGGPSASPPSTPFPRSQPFSRPSLLQQPDARSSNSSVQIGRPSQTQPSWRQRAGGGGGGGGDAPRMSFLHRRTAASYDFTRALVRRDAQGILLSDSQKREVSEMIAYHEWASSHQVLNVYIDNGRDKVTAHKILSAVPDKVAVMNHPASSPRHRNQTLKQDVVTREDLEKIRVTVRDILTNRDAMRRIAKQRPGDAEIAAKEAALTSRANDGRLFLVDCMTKCEAFATEVDLHGLDAHMATYIVYRRLKRDNNKFVLIAGQGHHSRNNISMVAEEAKLYMDNSSVKWDFDPFNRGRIVVQPRSPEIACAIQEPIARPTRDSQMTSRSRITGLSYARPSSVQRDFASLGRVSSVRSSVVARRDTQRSSLSCGSQTQSMEWRLSAVPTLGRSAMA